MTKALKKQLCYAGGTLAGWAFARLTKSKETVPFTIMGGLAGFAIAEQLIEEKRPKVVTAPRNDGPVVKQSSVEGLPKRRSSKKTKSRSRK